MAKRRVAGSRRSLIALVLIGFVLVMTGVIARRMLGVQQEERIRNLEHARDALEAERIRLDAAIRDASSRARLQPIAEQRLNMHLAKPGQQIILNRLSPSPPPRSSRDSATRKSTPPSP